MERAKITRLGDTLLIKTPYNADLVEEIKDFPSRRWNPAMKAWAVSAGLEDDVYRVVRKYFPIEGESEEAFEGEVIHVRVVAQASGKRTYCGGVTIDGHDIINLSYGSVNHNSPAFEVLEEKGGFVRGDGYIKRGNAHAYEVEYFLTLKARKGATFECTGRSGYCGKFEILKESEVASGVE